MQEDKSSKGLGMTTVIVVFAITATILISVFRGASWRAENELLPRYCAKESVVGVGEIGYDDITDTEERFFAEQLVLGKELNLPILIHTPHRDKLNGTKRSLALLREIGVNEEMVMVDHLNETTLPVIRDSGCWCGHSVYPGTKMSESRMVSLDPLT